MAEYETIVHEVKLDTVIAHYLKDLSVKRPDLKEITRETYVDVTKGRIAVILTCEKRGS